MIKRILFLSLILSPNFLWAGEILSCDYAKNDLTKGPNAPMIPAGKAKVEVNGSSFKAFRPMGTFISSPPLTDRRNGMLFLDDKTKIYAASLVNTEFAVSDRIAKTTEQWANCKIDEQANFDKKSGKEIEDVEKLSGEKAKQFFLNEKHAFTTNCLVWEDVTMITGKAPAMIIAGSVHMGTIPRWDGKEYSFRFNGGSMIARFKPAEPKHKLLIQAGDKFYGCGPSVVDHNYD